MPEGAWFARIIAGAMAAINIVWWAGQRRRRQVDAMINLQPNEVRAHGASPCMGPESWLHDALWPWMLYPHTFITGHALLMSRCTSYVPLLLTCFLSQSLCATFGTRLGRLLVASVSTTRATPHTHARRLWLWFPVAHVFQLSRPFFHCCARKLSLLPQFRFPQAC